MRQWVSPCRSRLLIVTPLQKIHVIEPYVSAVGFIDNPTSMESHLRTLTIEEYRAERLARTLLAGAAMCAGQDPSAHRACRPSKAATASPAWVTEPTPTAVVVLSDD